MNVVPAINFKDGYKADHRRQYPTNTVKVYSNFTPRKSRDEEIDSVIFFGLVYFIKDVILKEFQETFFTLPKEEVIARYKRRINNYLLDNDMDFDHIGALHDLGYLPVCIKALKEGALVKVGVPVLTITNELPQFYWLPNFLETIISTEVWPMTTSATTIFRYRLIFDEFAMKTVGNTSFSSTWQIHDFSMRGMFGRYAAFMSGAAHLLGSYGTDTIGAIDFLEWYYNADCEKETIGGSVPATEHSVMCMGKKEAEQQTFVRLMDLYKHGVLSIVSDTWDLWKVLLEILVNLKDIIMQRDGKLVIRPDSGDPVRILCGDVFEEFKTVKEATEFYADEMDSTMQTMPPSKRVKEATFKFLVDKKYYSAFYEVSPTDKLMYSILEPVVTEYTPLPEEVGVIELLWNTFGGSINELGYRELDPHIGAIYGDSINFERARQICQRLMDKGFASTNWVAGIGSYTYQYTTRDQYGFAMKATYGELQWPVVNVHINSKGQLVGECPEVVDGEVILKDKIIGKHREEDQYFMIEEREIFKDPITDDGTKKSAKGRLVVYKDEGEVYFMHDQVGEDEEEQGELEVVYGGGLLLRDGYLSEIRVLFNENVARVLARKRMR